MSTTLRLAILLIIAVVLAFAARIMFVQSQQESVPKDPEIQVRIASIDLPQGLLLRDEDLGWRTLPQSQVPKGAITEKMDSSLAQGALLRHPLKADSIIKTNDIISANAPGFLAAALKPGMRAVSLQVDDVSGNAGLIQPGDYVDMILTQRIVDDNGLVVRERQIVSETVVERARVIAVGSSFRRDADGSEPIRARTVTFEVQPGAAEAITVASQLGTISLALRSFATTERDPAALASEKDGAWVVAWGDLQDDGSHSGPVWGSDVSRVLGRQAQTDQAVTHSDTQQNKVSTDHTAPSATTANPRSLVIFRGAERTVINNQNLIQSAVPDAEQIDADTTHQLGAATP